MSFGKWLVVFSLGLVIFLVATSVVASPIEEEKTVSADQITLNTVPAPGALAANLVWSKAAGSISGYHIERSTDGGATWPTEFTISSPSNTYQDASVARGGTYWYRIFSSTDSTYSIASNTVRIFISDAAPITPIYLAAEINNTHSITLSWNNHSTAIDGYIVERASGKGANPGFTVVARLNSPLVTTWTDTKITRSAVYTYRVRSFSQFGTSYPTNSVQVIISRNP